MKYCACTTSTFIMLTVRVNIMSESIFTKQKAIEVITDFSLNILGKLINLIW